MDKNTCVHEIIQDIYKKPGSWDLWSGKIIVRNQEISGQDHIPNIMFETLALVLLKLYSVVSEACTLFHEVYLKQN